VAMACLIAPAARADYDIGIKSYERGDYEAAFAAWEPLAKSGDARAQHAVGVLLETGAGLPARNYDHAVTWYRLAAGQGLAAAQNNLARLVAAGLGVRGDAKLAAELWSAAAEAGHPLARFNFARAYELGVGVARDAEEAARWYAEAGNQGVAAAAFALSELYRTGRDRVPQHAELARLWWDAARKLGSPLQPARDFAMALPLEAVTAAETVARIAPAAGGAYYVQLLSGRLETELRAEAERLRAEHADVFDDAELYVRTIDLGATKGIWHRVVAGPLADRAAARGLCNRLLEAAKLRDCLVVGD